MADAGLRWCGVTLLQSNGGSQCQRLRRNHYLPRNFLLLPQSPRCRLLTTPRARSRRLQTISRHRDAAVTHGYNDRSNDEDHGLAAALGARFSCRRGEAELRERGLTDEEIAAWFKKLSERARKRSKKEFKKPSVDKVFEIVTRRAPTGTLRRKARSPRR